MNKKLICKKLLIFVLSLMFTMPVFADNGSILSNNAKNNQNSFIQQNQITRLKGLGFTDDEINTFNEAEYDTFSKLEGKVVSKSTKYYRVEKDKIVELKAEQALKEVKEYKSKLDKINNSKSSDVDALNSTIASDTSNCSWLTMTTTVSDTGSRTYLFKNSFQWLTTPFFTLKDVIGISVASSISIDSNGEYLKYTYDRYTNNTAYQYIGTQNIYDYSADVKNVTGYAFKYDIKGTSVDNTEIYTNHRGWMVFSGVATPIDFVGASNAFGHYAHQKLAGSISVDIFSGNMSVSPAFIMDEAPDTNVQFDIN